MQPVKRIEQRPLNYGQLKLLVTRLVCLQDLGRWAESLKLEHRFKLVIRQLEPDAHHATPASLL
jgi:hypothetical protein